METKTKLDEAFDRESEATNETVNAALEFIVEGRDGEFEKSVSDRKASELFGELDRLFGEYLKADGVVEALDKQGTGHDEIMPRINASTDALMSVLDAAHALLACESVVKALDRPGHPRALHDLDRRYFELVERGKERAAIKEQGEPDAPSDASAV